MHISLLTDGIFPYVIGGMQMHSYYLAKYFAKAGFKVDLYHTNQSGLNIDNLEVFSKEEKKNIRSFVIPFPSGGKLPGHYIKASYLYSELIFNIFQKQEPVNFVYAQGFTGWKLIEKKRSGFKCAPIGVNFHGYEMFQKAPNFKTYIASKYLLQKPVLYNITNADYVFSFGAKIQDIIEKRVSDKSKIIEMINGIEENWLNKKTLTVNKKLKFVFVGRFERRKGIEELTSALRRIHTKYNFEFHFIGPIIDKKRIIHENIFYHGKITSTEQMQNLLSAMDILVCPSHSEGMPYVILEAMASGLAIIATNVGAVSLMVDETNGVLLNDSNPESIANALVHYMSIDKNILIKQKQTSINKVKNNFLWEDIIQDTIRKISYKQ